MTESITPSDGGNAGLGVAQGADAIHSLLMGQSATTTAPEDEDDAPETDVEAGEAETSDAEAEADATDDEDDTADDGSQETTVRLPDGTELTLAEIAELQKGSLRQADYTRKTQELAEQRKATEAAIAEAQQRASHYEQQIDFAIRVAEQYLPPAPDASMLETDPIGYLQAKEHYQAKVGELRSLYEQREQHRQYSVAEQMRQFEDMKAKEGQALLSAMPHLKDKSRLEAFQKDILDALPAYGYTADDLKAVYDHRLVRMMADAIAWRKLQSQKPVAAKKAADAAPVVQAGKRSSPADQKARSVRDAQQRLRTSGSLRDGAAVLERLLKG